MLFETVIIEKVNAHVEIAYFAFSITKTEVSVVKLNARQEEVEVRLVLQNG